MAPQSIAILLAIFCSAAPAMACAELGGLPVELPAPAAGGATAILHIARTGYSLPSAQHATRIKVGSSSFTLRAGETRDVKIAADPHRLQRIVIDGRPWLVFIAPGQRLTLKDDPCSGWRLDADWLDSNLVGPADAYCSAEDVPCRAGYSDGSRPRLADDPLCHPAPAGAADVKRCVRVAAVRFTGTPSSKLELREMPEEAPTVLVAAAPSTATYRSIPWLACVAALATVRGDAVSLAIGPGQHWTLHVDENGQIAGTNDERK